MSSSSSAEIVRVVGVAHDEDLAARLGKASEQRVAVARFALAKNVRAGGGGKLAEMSVEPLSTTRTSPETPARTAIGGAFVEHTWRRFCLFRQGMTIETWTGESAAVMESPGSCDVASLGAR